jgi:hypothetical protein
MMPFKQTLQWLAATPATTVDDAQQQFQELFLQIGLALIALSVAAAYLKARKKKDDLKAEHDAKVYQEQQAATAKKASSLKSKSAKAKAARASASAKKDRA